MTFEHQTQMTNLMTRLAWESRIAEAAHKPLPDVEEIVAYMTFRDEVAAARAGRRRRPASPAICARRSGRSLRDFDLRTRLFRYPLSYMIYSAQFNALPDGVRNRIYRRLFDELRAKSPETVEILRKTKPDLPEYWRSP